jgi:hypothetical protein
MEKSLASTNAKGLDSLKNYFSPELESVALLTNIWSVSEDMLNFDDLSSLKDSFGNAIAERGRGALDGLAAYQTPLWFNSDTEKPSTDSTLNLNLAVRQFKDYLCSISTCLARDINP